MVSHMKKLLRRKYRFAELRDIHGNNLLHYVARGEVTDDKVKLLLKYFPALIFHSNNAGEGPLQYAVGRSPAMLNLFILRIQAIPMMQHVKWMHNQTL